MLDPLPRKLPGLPALPPPPRQGQAGCFHLPGSLSPSPKHLSPLGDPAPAPGILAKGHSLLDMPCGSRTSNLIQNPPHGHHPFLLFKIQMNCNLSHEAFPGPADKNEPFLFGTPIGFPLYLFVPKLYSIHLLFSFNVTPPSWSNNTHFCLVCACVLGPNAVPGTEQVSVKAQEEGGRREEGRGGGREARTEEERRGRQGQLAGSLGHSDYPVHLHYRPNVCVCPQNSYSSCAGVKSYPSCAGIRGWVGPQGWSPPDWNLCPH